NAGDATLWRTFTLNLMEAVTVHGWGATGHTLRLDPGGSAGHHLLIRNIKINLSGSGSSATSRQFLESMNIGATIGIRMNVTINGQPLPGNKPNICGMDRLILQNGQPAANNWDEAHPRTAAGYSEDGTKAYLITVDGRQSNVSVGVTTRQLADIFRVAGAWTALNLDGGGSTRMEVLGKLANSATENRRVANALMVVTSAPPTGDTKLILSTENLELAPGASRQIMTSVCDGNENIVNYLPAGVGYRVTGGIGAVTSGGKFTAGADNAEGYIRVSYGGMKDSVHVAVRRPVDEGNALLKSVEPSAGTLSPAFNPAVTSYKILFPELPAFLSITAETAEPASTVSGTPTNVTVNEGQEFTLTVTSVNGTTRTYRFTVELSPATGTESLPAGSVRIYPNPLDNQKILHIDLDKAYDNVPVKIYNAAGIPLHAVRETGQFLRIPLNLPAGVYILQINLDRQIKTGKLVIRDN
ncbi:MAG: phosphodiester glycosidase family protein, partial [Bacteroidales bacterium]|nr:phosphodiester glycosidase family protein [Bacteroidales bacterium]